MGTPNGAGGLNYASHFYVADALGTLRGMTDGGAQGFSDGLNFDGFGNLVGRVGNTSVPLGYGEGSGYVTDGDTGLRLLGHRYYDSRTGRFISRDPAGDGGNWYAYAGNNPVNKADPTGLSMGLPGMLGAPDQRYGGSFGGDAGGLFDGDGGGLDDFFNSEDDAMQRGQQGYLAAVANTAAWVEATTLADGALVVSTDTPVSGTEGMDGVMLAAGNAQSSVTTPEGIQAVAQLQEDGIVVGKQGLQKEAEELSHIGNWGKGSYNTAKEYVEDHFKRKGVDVNAENLLQYLRKAEGFSQNLKKATTKGLENGATRFTKSEKYIIKDIEGLIVSFGKAR